MGCLKIYGQNRIRISSTLLGVDVRGAISIYCIGGTIIDNVIPKCGALVGRFVGCQISITGICSNKLKELKVFSGGRNESDFSSRGVTVLSWRGRWRRSWTSCR